MADPNQTYEPKPVEAYKPCYVNKLYVESISEETRGNIIAEFAFCAGKHNIISGTKKELEDAERYKCKDCRKEVMQFEKFIKINAKETKLTKEFIKKFIYYKIDKHEYWFIITKADKEYLNRPEVTLEYLSRPEVKHSETTELTDEETL